MDVEQVHTWADSLRNNSDRDDALDILLECAADQSRSRVERIRALSGIRALPPTERYPDQDSLWPTNTTQQAIRFLTEIFTNNTSDMVFGNECLHALAVVKHHALLHTSVNEEAPDSSDVIFLRAAASREYHTAAPSLQPS